MFDIVEVEEGGVRRRRIVFTGGGQEADGEGTRKYYGTGRPPHIPKSIWNSGWIYNVSEHRHRNPDTYEIIRLMENT